MEPRRYVNQSLPQTLYIATVLLYISAAFGLIFGSAVFQFGPVIGLAILIGKAAAGYGIANEKRWGYILGVATAGATLVPFALVVVADGIGVLLRPLLLIYMVFPVALFVALVHPQSREYQRIWFT
jgi:hypothetical protein